MRETDADYPSTPLGASFGARYYISCHGRWLTPDWSARAEAVPYASLTDPQTLNLYAYVGNNPVRGSAPAPQQAPAQRPQPGQPRPQQQPPAGQKPPQQ